MGDDLPYAELPSTEPAYAELHCHSNFSFLDGASHPEALVAEAVRHGLAALALTDHDGLYGVVRFHEAAVAAGLATVFGAELTLSPAGPRTGEPDPAGHHLVVLARDPDGYARLSRSIADAHLAAGEKGRPAVRLDDLAGAHGGHWQVLTGCRKGAVPAAVVARRPPGRPARARPPRRRVRPRARRGRAVGPRRPARLDPQRRARSPRRPGRHRPRCHQQRPLRPSGRLRAGRHRRRGAGQPTTRPARRLAAGIGCGRPAVRRRAGPAVRPLARRRRPGGRDRRGVRVRPATDGTPAPDLPGADGAHRTELADRADRAARPGATGRATTRPSPVPGPGSTRSSRPSARSASPATS